MIHTPENPFRPETRTVKIGESFTVIDPSTPDFKREVEAEYNSVIYRSSINLQLGNLQIPFDTTVSFDYPDTTLDNEDLIRGLGEGDQLRDELIDVFETQRQKDRVVISLETKPTDVLQTLKLAGKKGFINRFIMSVIQNTLVLVPVKIGDDQIISPSIGQLKKVIYDTEPIPVEEIIGSQYEFTGLIYAPIGINTIKTIKARFIPGALIPSI